MKKITVVFLVTLTVLAAGILAVSCNSAVNEKFGTVVLDFGGASDRALGSDALPVLSTVRIQAEVTSSAGRTVQEYEAGNQGNISLSLPVGERVVIKVSAYNPSGIWSGSVTHTVEQGTNAVGIKLKKNVSGLNNLLFTETKVPNPAVSGSFFDNLSLYMDGKTFNAPQGQKGHSFARDSKGRVYVLYKDAPTSFRIVRYTSEGNGPEPITTPVTPAPPFTPSAFMNDFTRGVFYIVSSLGAVHKIEGSSVDSSPLTTLPHFKGASAIDNNRVVWIPGGGSRIKICVKDLTSSASAASEEIEIENDIKIHNCANRDLNDIFIRGGYVYVLFTALKDSPAGDTNNLYSLGGVVRYNINNLAEPPVKIGFSNSVGFENQAVPASYYSENFYGAVKVIGFDDENLYIADDGFDAAYFAESPHIVKTRNRIAALNMTTNTVSFTEEYTAKWYNEWKERRTPDTKTIVWNKEHDGDGNFKKTIFKELGSSDNLFETTASNNEGIFTFDQSGTLYIPYKDGSHNKIKRFVQNENGSYKENGGCQITGFPDFIAADTSCSLKFAVGSNNAYHNVLYYANYSSNVVERLVWQDNFGTASEDTGYSAAGAAISSGWKVTALAANKDGLFVALRKQNSGTHAYGIKIERYAKDSGALSGSVILVPEGTLGTKDGFEIDEKITALHIQDGILYALTAKKMKEDSSSPKERLFSSGKLWYISGTADFRDSKRVLYASSETSSEDDTLEKNFTPCRFIAVKPKKLVIASDGYYGREWGWYTPKNFDKVVTFDIGSWTPLGEPVENTTFTKFVIASAGYYFLP